MTLAIVTALTTMTTTMIMIMTTITTTITSADPIWDSGTRNPDSDPGPRWWRVFWIQPVQQSGVSRPDSAQ